MELKLKTVSTNDYSSLSNDIELLLSKKIDLIKLEAFVNLTEIGSIFNTINRGLDNFNKVKLDIPDGFFYPAPYSTVQGEDLHANEVLKNYFKNSFFFNDGFSSNELGNIHKWYIKKLEEKFNIKLVNLKTEFGLEFAKLNLRILQTGKNGIDIHCENAFIHQLIPSFSNWLKSKIDLENSLSVFTVIQPAAIGGELFVYNIDWERFKHKLNDSTYEERHDIEGSFFKARGISAPQKTTVALGVGDTVVFRAAQIWHAINKIDGLKDRITLGCFLAKGNDNTIYYWS